MANKSKTVEIKEEDLFEIAKAADYSLYLLNKSELIR